MSDNVTMTPHERFMTMTPKLALDAFQWEDISTDTDDEPGAGWTTVKIPGFDRDYVVFVYPHGC